MLKKNIMILITAFLLLGCHDSEINKETDNEIADTDHEQPFMLNEDAKDEDNDTGISVTNAKEKGILKVHYIDVGQGDAALLEYHHHHEDYHLLFDTGDWLGSEVIPYLQQENIDSLDVVIISHPHADHIGQLTQVMENLSVEEVWMSGNTAGSDVFTNSLEAVQNSDAVYEEPRAGDQYDMGPLELTVLHPDALTGKLNEDSLSIHFEFGLTSFLFTGDAYVDEEKAMMASGLPLEADVLQLGHHGSNTSSSEAFINKVDPEIGIYSAGIDNTYGHPHDEVVSLFEKKGILLYGTDQNGNIIVTSDGTTVEVENIKQKQEQKKKTSNMENVDDNEVVEDSMSGCIDINHASKDKLTEIIHIGEARAEKLMELRPFNTIDDLNKINGIAEKRLIAIKSENKACIGGN